MKRALGVIKKILVIIFALVLLSVMAIFTYHHYQLSNEAKLIKDQGTLVDIKNKNINVYEEGRGEETFVFMSGSGIASPVYEMKGLFSEFSKEHKVAVVERAGYGYSDLFHDERDIDSILKQTREALVKSGNKPPYVLVPHSISGIEAIYWAQKYPDEIKSIIGLDIGLPQEYAKYKMTLADTLVIRGMNLLTRMGVHRLFPDATYDPEVLNQPFLTEEEKEVFKAISYKKAFNKNMMEEVLQSYQNSKKSTSLPAPKDTPILFLSAYTDQNLNSKFTIQKNKNYQAFADQLAVSEVKEIEGKHSLYLYAPEEIYELTMDFINKLE